ncbi:MAG: protein kinase, partial [Clostridiales bacterium]|nr:protein kinase [Clostridiales bacterium]
MIDTKHLCPGCMERWEDTQRPCPCCGFTWDKEQDRRAQPLFTILGGRYLLGQKIGSGGFGITYIAMDLVEEKKNAVKEFFPFSLSEREGENVVPFPGEEGRDFRKALRSFRKEGELLSRVKSIDGIVNYLDFVDEYGTSYLVMEYVEGQNLKQYMRQQEKNFTQEEALTLMRPILLA